MTDRYVLLGQTPVPEPDLMIWAAWFEEHSNSIVKQERLLDLVLVATVFLGFDHRFGAGPPLLFETMTFWDGGDSDVQERCSTWSEAEEQHARIAREALQPSAVWRYCWGMILQWWDAAKSDWEEGKL